MRCIRTLLALILLPSLVWADGVLTPAANPVSPLTVLSQSAIPFIKASSGTMGDNGAISGMTALPKTFSAGAYLYLPANAISAGSAAGWYWFVGSSDTAGTVYNSTYTSGVPVVGTTTAFATTGPGAYTGEAGVITSVSITMPGGMMGKNGQVDAQVVYVFNNSGGSKVHRILFGGTTVKTQTLTTQLSNVFIARIRNRGLTNVQSLGVINAHGTNAAGDVANAVDGTVDTTAPVAIAFTMSAPATDHVIVDSYQIDVRPAP